MVEFLRINRLNFQWIDLIGSLEIYANGWVEFILNKGKDKINKVFVKDPAYCRNAKMDIDHPSRIPYLFFSAQWDLSPNEADGSLVKIPMYDPFKYDGKRYQYPQFAYPVFYRSFNKSYYHLSVWNDIRQSGWLTTGAKIDSSSVYFSWKETHIRESRIESTTIEKLVYKVTGFQNFLIWSGGIAWAIIVILLAIKLIRFYLKRQLLP